MIEYLHTAIRASAGENIAISAEVTDELGNIVTEDCALIIYLENNGILMIGGNCIDGIFTFEVPGDMTKDLKGRYWYCVRHNGEPVCFKQPIYFV